MTTPNEYLPVLAWFHGVMEQKLGLKGNIDKSHWKFAEEGYLYSRLADELLELSQAIVNKDDTAVILECADVANFVMMIADTARTRVTLKLGKEN